MPKNILIFANGTGNEGGLLPDESRTNVYKLYRATRTGPDSIVDPKKQLALYVPGIGTPTPGHHTGRDRQKQRAARARGGRRRGRTAEVVGGGAPPKKKLPPLRGGPRGRVGAEGSYLS